MLCFVYDCDHRSENHSCKFFRFPPKQNEYKKWLEFCQQKDSAPSNRSSRICSSIIDGEKTKGFDRESLPSPSVPACKRKKSVLKRDETSSPENKDDINHL